MNAKNLGIAGAVSSPIIGVAAYGLYSSGRPTYALIWGVIALILAYLSIVNFRTARQQSRGH